MENGSDRYKTWTRTKRVTFIISEKRPRIVTLHDFQISKIMDGP